MSVTAPDLKLGNGTRAYLPKSEPLAYVENGVKNMVTYDTFSKVNFEMKFFKFSFFEKTINCARKEQSNTDVDLNQLCRIKI